MNVTPSQAIREGRKIEYSLAAGFTDEDIDKAFPCNSFEGDPEGAILYAKLTRDCSYAASELLSVWSAVAKRVEEADRSRTLAVQPASDPEIDPDL